MGFPTKMFTPLFALGRLPGWIAQYREMISDPAKRIGRPRQVYTGEIERHYIAMRRRKRAAEYPGTRVGETSLDHVNKVWEVRMRRPKTPSPLFLTVRPG